MASLFRDHASRGAVELAKALGMSDVMSRARPRPGAGLRVKLGKRHGTGPLKDGIVWGWASIVEKDGKPVVDHQGDVIDEPELVKAAHDFMTHSRTGGAMHVLKANGEPLKGGAIVESIVFTRDLQKALGINLGKVGWLIGYRITDPAVRREFEAGRLPSFSIGGSGHREYSDNGN